MEDKSREYGQNNLTLPHDVVPLPSQGVFYKNKKKSLKVGYLTASDENILMGGGLDLTSNLLRAKIYEPDVKIEDLLEGDVEAILVFLRNTSFGPEMNVTATDPKTGKPFSTQVMLDEMNITKGEQPQDDGTFLTSLPKSGVTVKLRPLTYGEIMELRKFEENYPKGRVVPSVTWRLGREIVELDGETDKGKIAKSLEIMPIMDSKFIRRFLDQNEPRLEMKREVTTPSGEKLTVNVGFGVEFFRPFF
jgi:hypothetical protein